MSPSRRLRFIGASLVLVVVSLLVVAAWLGVRGLSAQRHLEAAQADLGLARTALLEGEVEPARRAVAAAGERTARARALTGDVVWRAMAAVPALGATPETVRGVVRSADVSARVVLPAALDGVEQLDPSRLRRPDGSIDLAAVRAGTPPVEQAAERAAEVMKGLQELPLDRTVPQVTRRAADVTAAAADVAEALGDASSALALVPPLLGEDRPRRYLVLVQQTSEARATGGIVGGYVELIASQGRLTEVSSGSNADLRGGDVEPPPDLPPGFADAYRSTGVFRFWQRVNETAHLPTVEKLVQARWQAQGGEPLDAVVLLDSVALSLALDGGDPLPLAEGAVAPADLVEYLAVGQYRDFAPADGDVLDQSQERKDQLDEVAGVAAARLTGGAGDPRALVEGLVAAARSGHVRIVSRDPILQPLLEQAGVSEGLPAGPAPVAFAVVSNTSGGKLDYFLERRLTYTAEGCAADRRRSTVTVELTSAVPPTDLPPYLTILSGPQNIGVSVSRDIALALSIYVTPGSELVRASVDGGPVAPEAPGGAVITSTEEFGLPRFQLPVSIPEGQTRTVRLELDEPVAAGAPRVPEQPLARPLERVVDVPVCG